jgi:5-methyltetrahydrofolate--homocysteine methyltransferase
MNRLLDAIGREVLVFDGAMGTMLQSAGLPPGGCPDLWVLTHPEKVAAVHRAYVEAGAQIVETNTFGATPCRLSHYDAAHLVREVNVAAVRIAREAVAGRALVAASMGPLGLLIEPLGETSFDEAYAQFAAQARALYEARPDFIIIETIADLNELRAALLACKDCAPGIRVIAQITIDPGGRAFTGTDPANAALLLQAMGADIVGLNCSVGPQQMVEAVAAMARVARIPISCLPNAGLPLLQPDGRTVFPMGPEEFASWAPKLVEAGASLVGGCCGTTPGHIRRVRAAVEGMKPGKPREPLHHLLGLSSRTQTLFCGEQNLPVIIGERINPTGRKLLTADIKEGRFQLVRKEAREQVAAGAQMLDVNVGVPLIDEAAAMERAIQVVQEAVDVPLVIDSPDPRALEAGLKRYCGRALVNSFSGEPERIERVLPLAKRYGAAVIGLCLDGGGIPASARQRLEIARRLVREAEAAGIRPQDVVIDCLALPAGADQSSARETLKAIRMVKEELGCLTSLGVSNVSFGLPQRPFLNAAFLLMCLSAGLDMAIINPLDERLMDLIRAGRLLLGRDRNAREYLAVLGGKELVHTLAEAERRLAKAGRLAGPSGGPGNGAQAQSGHAAPGSIPSSGPLAAPTGSTTGAIRQEARPAPTDPLGLKLYTAILEGDKDGILGLVEEGLGRGYDPMQMLSDYLIPGIEEVGRLFGEGTYFLPQLMLSAQAMKKAFARLKPELQKSKAAAAEVGTIVLATVQGDIHDIGKNICAVLLENYGFRVIDLGRDVKNEVVLEQARKAGADIVGLSALMTTTMPQMKRVIELFAREGFDCPVIIGGAATTRAFAEQIGAAGYGRDAQEAVAVALKILEQRKRQAAAQPGDSPEEADR